VTPESAQPFENPDDEAIRRLLAGVRRIAVVGLSPKPHRDSHRVARYLIAQGYEVIPVYPREDTILGQPVFRQVRDITGGVDLVDVFRRSEQLPEVVEDSLLGRVSALWFQLGCVHAAAARRAVESGAIVVMDRCLMVEHERLLGRS
jgi:predicted CoA-binding protein